MTSYCAFRSSRSPASVLGSTLLSLSLTATPLQAEKRCDWHGPLSGGEFPYAKCVDFAALEGKTLDLPGNVTRISADGLSFCQPATSAGGSGNADIVFIYDNSNSMTADAAYIDPVDKDTDFVYLSYEFGNHCDDNLITPAATFSYPSREGGAVTVRKMSGIAGCQGSIAGDPYKARGTVIRTSLDFLAASSPSSTAGSVSFATEIANTQEPLRMNSAANLAKLKAGIKLDTSGRTFYRKPLQQAKEWLNNPALIKTGKQAIIFISDGAPTDNGGYLDLVDEKMPPIHSIFLSKAVTPDTARLKELSDRTGGTFTRVNPNHPAAMETLLKSIITTITRNTAPKSVLVSNKSLSPPQTSRSIEAKAHPDGSVGMALDSIVGLQEGVNQIEIRLTREDSSVVAYHFGMKVAGKPISASRGNHSCWDQPTLTALDPKTGLVPEMYDPDGKAYPLKLTRSPSELKEVTVAGASANRDRESIVLRKIDLTRGFPTQTGEFAYDPDQADPDAGNGILEVDGKGDLTLVWSHPRDPRETATYILPGRVVPVIDGKATLHILEPVIQGEAFDAGSIRGKHPVVILDGKDRCVLNCAGTEIFQTGKGVPTWELVVKSPFRYSIRLFDNLGHFIGLSRGELGAGDWAKLAKSGDSAAIRMKILPVARNGQQLATGAYLMRAEIIAMGDLVTLNANGESVIVRNSRTEYLNRFGYIRL